MEDYLHQHYGSYYGGYISSCKQAHENNMYKPIRMEMHKCAKYDILHANYVKSNQLLLSFSIIINYE